MSLYSFFDYDLLTLMEKGDIDCEISSALQQDNDGAIVVDTSRATLLHFAARCGNATIAKYFIDSGNDINALDNFKKTPLTLALENSNDAIVQLLLDANADIYTPNDDGVSSLRSVVGSYVSWSNADGKRQSIIKMFLERVEKDFSSDLDAMAEKLFEAYCPLHLAIKYIKNTEVTRKMLDAGRSVNELEPVTEISALHVAVDLTDLEHVKLLIERGACVSAKDREERTPLHFYDPLSDDTDDKLGILKILIKRGACLVTPGGKWPIAQKLLLSGKRQTVAAVLQHISLFARNDRDDTPLHLLVCNKNPGVLEALMTKKFYVNACNQRGYTVLMTAAMRGTFDAVDFLLTNGADVNVANPSGFTALFYAYCNTSLENDERMKMVKLLLRYGADFQHELPDDQMTIFDVAKSYTSLQPVLDHLAMTETAGHRVSERIRNKIDSDAILKTYYYCFAKKQYERTNWTTRQ